MSCFVNGEFVVSHGVVIEENLDPFSWLPPFLDLDMSRSCAHSVFLVDVH